MYGKACIALIGLLMMGCGSVLESNEEPKSKADSLDDPLFAEESAESREKVAPAGPSCADAEGYDIECLSDKDCCSGFYCGYDPEGSHRVKTCLYGG